jgi:hypothetical protein
MCDIDNEDGTKNYAKRKKLSEVTKLLSTSTRGDGHSFEALDAVAYGFRHHTAHRGEHNGAAHCSGCAPRGLLPSAVEDNIATLTEVHNILERAMVVVATIVPDLVKELNARAGPHYPRMPGKMANSKRQFATDFWGRVHTDADVSFTSIYNIDVRAGVHPESNQFLCGEQIFHMNDGDFVLMNGTYASSFFLLCSTRPY